MRRRHQNGHQRPFPPELLDLPLPLSDADRARVEVAREAAGWSIIDYLRARGDRRRARLQG
ncbi:hypothetical protein [Micromonospora sp. U21]|uniref:hypothetical protein n=1 Tax=Micromonospora sp. U21 TaxID=2824899 RepID=UPI001B37ECC0|nr:hypothetical protein [Micromonospora sp. U21]MBQ0902681.1 hypothetical protein [Micromonospora sp. U21]